MRLRRRCRGWRRLPAPPVSRPPPWWSSRVPGRARAGGGQQEADGEQPEQAAVAADRGQAPQRWVCDGEEAPLAEDGNAKAVPAKPRRPPRSTLFPYATLFH